MWGRIVFAVLLLTASSPALAVEQTSGSAQPSDQGSTRPTAWPPQGVLLPGGSIVAPRAIKEAKPHYPHDAKKAGIEGSVVMQAVIKADGHVGEVRVMHSLDRKFGLDDEAVRTLKKWRFAPGTKDGVPVPVLIQVDMTFSLHGNAPAR